MAENKTPSFTVTDRRLFTSDGELRTDASEEQYQPAKPSGKPAEEPSPVQSAPAETGTQESAPAETDTPEPLPPSPSAAEQKEQADAYQKSSQEMDRQVELSGHSSKELEISFERFLASLYMTGMLQLGLMQEQGGQPQLDLIGARQTIDSLSLLAKKTKGNLTPKEQNFLQNALYELRMAYIEVTNAIARGPQQVPAAK